MSDPPANSFHRRVGAPGPTGPKSEVDQLISQEDWLLVFACRFAVKRIEAENMIFNGRDDQDRLHEFPGLDWPATTRLYGDEFHVAQHEDPYQRTLNVANLRFLHVNFFAMFANASDSAKEEFAAKREKHEYYLKALLIFHRATWQYIENYNRLLLKGRERFNRDIVDNQVAENKARTKLIAAIMGAVQSSVPKMFGSRDMDMELERAFKKPWGADYPELVEQEMEKIYKQGREFGKEIPRAGPGLADYQEICDLGEPPSF